MFTRSRIIVVILFILALAAGFSVARLMEKRHPAPPDRGPSWLSAELELTPEQRQGMLDIWNGLNRANFADGDRRRDLSRQRSEAIRQLIPQDQQETLAAIDEQYNKQSADLSAQRRLRYEDAMARTKALMTPEQYQKYEQMLERREQDRRRGPDRPGDDRSPRPDRPGRGGPDRPGPDRQGPPLPPPASQPAV